MHILIIENYKNNQTHQNLFIQNFKMTVCKQSAPTNRGELRKSSKYWRTPLVLQKGQGGSERMSLAWYRSFINGAWGVVTSSSTHQGKCELLGNFIVIGYIILPVEHCRQVLYLETGDLLYFIFHIKSNLFR